MRDLEVQFVEGEGGCVAYAIFGSGPIDLVVRPGVCPIDMLFDLPQLAQFLDTLGQIARVIAYDNRGAGASDPFPYTDGAAGIESQASDLLAVLDAAGSEQASVLSLFTNSAEIVNAAIYPHRVRSLILNSLRSSFPELRGMTREQRRTIALWRSSPDGLKFFNPRIAHDAELRRWWGRALRLCSTPEQVIQQMEFAAELDIGDLLDQIRTPTLVFHSRGNRMWDIDTSRATAARIPNCRFVERPGSENELFLGDTDLVLGEITQFLAGSGAARQPENRQLATVLFTDIVASTEQLAAMGDHRWRQILDDHDRMVSQAVTTYNGRVIKGLGDGLLATFDGPARAIRCATDVLAGLRQLDLDIRAGLHTGEVELRGSDIGGLAVHIGARVAALAGRGEVVVSSTVKDLVAGSGIEFDDRGEHELKGVPGTWRLFAVRP